MQMISIIILDPYENPIIWLDTDVSNISERCKVDEPREITLTYPLGLYEKHDVKEWFKQGNKIYVPSTLGIDSCLYVINSSYSIDYWDNNQVTLTAEEVLVELNNVPYWYTDSKTIKLDYKFMDAQFGEFYDINKDIKFPSENNTILPKGSMNKMELLRMIEDTTDLVVVTEYISIGTKIERKMDLVSLDDIGKLWDNQVLDLNYNLESLEFDVSEENTYTAMFPEITINENQNNAGTVANNDKTKTNPNALLASQQISTTEELQQVMKSWLDLEVKHRERIPMIVEKTQSELKYTSYYYSPFTKRKGDIQIENPIYTETSYDRIIPYNTKEVKKNPLSKMGSASTTQTDVWSIFSVLANKLIEHRNPTYKLKISLKDLQSILPEDSPLGFSLWDTLLVKAPGFDNYIPVTVTETKKNPHLAGDNTITVESNVTQKHALYDSHITAYNQIINSNEELASIGGVLMQNTVKQRVIDEGESIPAGSVEGDYTETPIANGDIIINISLKKGYSENEIYDIVYHILEFKPETETYLFSQDEILNTEKYVRNYIIKNSKYPDTVNMRDVKGLIYRVPWQWVRSIYYTYIQLFTETEINKVGKGSYVKTVEVHLYPMAEVKEKIIKEQPKYYPSWFYHSITDWRGYMQKTLGVTTIVDDIVSAGDLQTGGDCVPTACSNGSEILWNYRSEEQMAITIKTLNYKRGTGSEGGTIQGNEIKYLPTLGYNAKSLKNDWSEVLSACQDIKTFVIGHVFASELPWYSYYHPDDDKYRKGSRHGGHGIHIRWAGETSSGQKYVYIEDSNYTAFEPTVMRLNPQTKKYEPMSPERHFLTWEEFSTALKNEGLIDICAFTLSERQLSTDVVDRSNLTDKEMHRKLITYEFELTELKGAFKEMYTNLLKRPNQIPSTMTVEIVAKDTSHYVLDGKTIKSLAYTLLYNFKGKYQSVGTSITKIDDNSNWYIDNIGKDMDLIPMYCDKQGKEIYFALTNILFRYGLLYLPYDIEKAYSDVSDFKKIITAITGLTSKEIKLGTAKMNRTESNLKKVFGWNVGKGEPVVCVLSFAKINDKNIPIIVTELNGTQVKYWDITVEGNSPSKKDKLTESPIKSCTVAEYLTMCNNYDSSNSNVENNNNFLVIGLSNSAVTGGL